ncbi:hypothetical protein PsorP6_013360 [Peronosclerospora sorghi]|uniref:Uncharacterized protein n=1 Tax=Peronosclerospora sorghi TaxID=230839 RepID=A0ACC0WJL8_9STRA|nr:hypothetical protein PsorP6_013360 [Peronosclerospora sorghi]
MLLLLGKQLEAKDELGRIGFWDSGCEEGLSFKDQGVLCIRSDVDCRQSVAFAWLGSNLFASETIRDTPAYVLRFLLTLSPNKLHAAYQKEIFNEWKVSSTGPRNSCSVAFRVQKQVEQRDSVTCGPVTKTMIPNVKCKNSVWLAGGVVPAIAVERSTPLLTEWVEQNIVLPFGRIQAVNALDDLLIKFHRFPEKEPRDVRSKYNGKVEEVKGQHVSEIYRNIDQSAKVSFSVKGSLNTAASSFLKQYENSGVSDRFESQAFQKLLKPQMSQQNMQRLSNAYQGGESVFEVVLEMVVSGNQPPYWCRHSYKVVLSST